MPKKVEEKKAMRAMPASPESEIAVLGSMLIDNDVANEIVPMLKKDDFYIEKHGTIFDVMAKLQANGTPIDTFTVADALDVAGKLDEVGSIAYLNELASSQLTAANGKYYADIVKRDGLIRRVIRAGNNIVLAGYEAEDGMQALGDAERLVYAISEGNYESTLVKGEKAFSVAMDNINLAQGGNAPQNSVRTHFDRLDRSTKGFKPGELIILAARPGVGKTAFALNVAVNVALLEKKTVAIFCLEMDAPLIAKRMLAYCSQVTFDEMDVMGGMSSEASDRLFNAYGQLQSANIYIDDYRLNTPNDILSKCRRLKREHGLDLVIVDYLQLMKSYSPRGFESRQVEVSEMSRLLKIYAGELGCPILSLSQMSRGATQRKELPQLSDLRESGSIEQDADVVMFLHNPSSYNEALPPDQIQLLIRKNRNGPLKEIWLKWEGNTTTFREFAEDKEPSQGEGSPAQPAKAKRPEKQAESAPTPEREEPVPPPENDSATVYDSGDFVGDEPSEERDDGLKKVGDIEDGLVDVAGGMADPFDLDGDKEYDGDL